jgi:molecular chaperone DnaK (HSP70)
MLIILGEFIKLNEQEIDELPPILVHVTSHSLGIRIVPKRGRDYDVVLPKGTKFSEPVTRDYRTRYVGQESVEIAVFEGESLQIKDNVPLGNFSIEGLPNIGKKLPIKVTFALNYDGILEVSAEIVGYPELTNSIKIVKFNVGLIYILLIFAEWCMFRRRFAKSNCFLS